MFKRKQTKKQFIIAKSSKNTTYGNHKLNYKKNIEKALVIALLVTIFGFRLTMNLNLEEKYSTIEKNLTFKFIDIPEISPPIGHPPKLKVENLKVQIEEAKQENEINEITEVNDQVIAENQKKVQLALTSDQFDDYDFSTSPMGSVLHSELNIRKYREYDGANIILRNRNADSDTLMNSVLNIGKVKRRKRQLISENTTLDLTTRKTEQIKSKFKEIPTDQTGLNLPGNPQKILRFASSTIGTEDYQLWNKINSELDRLNKGRYGSVPSEIKRHRNGFLISFSYPDGTRHEIHWRNDGNVWIKVIGRTKKSNIHELGKTLERLLSLSLRNA